jgi:hypothetical protein
MNEQLQNELEEQARLLGMSAERECDLSGKLERERALADRLGQSLLRLSGMSPLIHAHAMDDLTAWKEARSE